ncbi:MAG: hypothetical protein K2J24_01810 [Muribaculaceae bacterium]|nr:hypothetical protein [Muribaculaceae bacterium]
MKKLLYWSIAFVIGITGCADKTKSVQKSKKILPADSLVMVYSDDLFSLLLPQGWKYETDTCETWPIRHIVDSLKITSGVVEFYPPDDSFKIRLVKGATRWIAPDYPVTNWAALSQMRANTDSTCIYISDVTDSISIDGNQACNYWSAYSYEGDTIIQDQYIVIKDKYDLYYINGVYDYDDNESPRLFQKILSTIKLK